MLVIYIHIQTQPTAYMYYIGIYIVGLLSFYRPAFAYSYDCLSFYFFFFRFSLSIQVGSRQAFRG